MPYIYIYIYIKPMPYINIYIKPMPYINIYIKPMPYIYIISIFNLCHMFTYRIIYIYINRMSYVYGVPRICERCSAASSSGLSIARYLRLTPNTVQRRSLSTLFFFVDANLFARQNPP